MDDRAVTFRQFVKMSEEEREKAYQYLSDEDKLKVCVCMEPQRQRRIVPCNVCVHREKNTPNCKAFTDGIDAQHIRDLMNDSSKECGNGYRFANGEDS